MLRNGEELSVDEADVNEPLAPNKCDSAARTNTSAEFEVSDDDI